jgi:hypothetical protein
MAEGREYSGLPVPGRAQAAGGNAAGSDAQGCACPNAPPGLEASPATPAKAPIAKGMALPVRRR